MTGVSSREGTVQARVAATPVLSATGGEKSYRRGRWPARRQRLVRIWSCDPDFRPAVPPAAIHPSEA
jgi:hypothetical protein